MQNRYSLWGNLSLLLLLIVAFIYALPNFFGEDPSVQISANSEQVQIDQALTNKIQELLQSAQITAKGLTHQNNEILLRFADEDTQIRVCDLLKNTLGEQYTVALNLAARTPRWLRMIGAHPIKLGLDLRGGVHFLLEVDLDTLMKNREESDLRLVMDELRSLNVRTLAIERLASRGLSIKLRNKGDLNRVVTALKQHFPDYQIETNDTASLTSVKITMSDEALRKVADYALEQTAGVLQNRVNELGVSEAIVQRQGLRYVSVDLPGIQDTARAKELIGKTASLRFQLVDTEHDLHMALAGGVPFGSKLYTYGKHKLLLKNRAVLQGNAITYAAASIAMDGRPAVDIRLGGGGEAVFHRVTAENIGNPMAVVYAETKTERKEVDGKMVLVSHPFEKIISIATIQSASGNNFVISGLRSDKEAQDLALLLRSGALVAPVSIVQETTVGPSMGKANVVKGILSIAVGYLLVMLFMAAYYHVFGLISNLALLCNLILMLAILSLMGAALTLPGMAGMVLTVGLAVDSSVLIYERIREELRNGSGSQASIYHGYDRAFATIVDANVATLIVALVLFALGSGAVKGFAVVLMIGLMTSMLTSIVFTRALVNLFFGRKNSKSLPIGM